ncbi:MAG: LamG domain-containing protein [Candidatus Omnitrophica bacterium]|nr:LamG domain-containing protein [Candidatus Omnitrophota bacterium]
MAMAAGACAAASPDYAREVRADKPLAWWRLDDGFRAPGAATQDKMSAHPGVYRGGVTSDPAGPPTGGEAARFDGVSGYVEIPHHPDFALNTFSIEFWFKSSQVWDEPYWPGSATLVSKATAGVASGDWDIIGGSNRRSRNQGRIIAAVPNASLVQASPEGQPLEKPSQRIVLKNEHGLRWELDRRGSGWTLGHVFFHDKPVDEAMSRGVLALREIDTDDELWLCAADARQLDERTARLTGQGRIGDVAFRSDVEVVLQQDLPMASLAPHWKVDRDLDGCNRIPFQESHRPSSISRRRRQVAQRRAIFNAAPGLYERQRQFRASHNRIGACLGQGQPSPGPATLRPHTRRGDRALSERPPQHPDVETKQGLSAAGCLASHLYSRVTPIGLLRIPRVHPNRRPHLAPTLYRTGELRAEGADHRCVEPALRLYADLLHDQGQHVQQR